MIDKNMQVTVQEIQRLATEINQMAKGIANEKIGPWTKWFAWHPVKTIGGDRVWGRRCYRRTRYTIFKRYAGCEYATDFDLLKDDKQ